MPAKLKKQLKTIGLTGFNEDVVANRTNVSPASTTSQAYDDDNGNVLYENGYTNATGVAETPGGLPIGGNITYYLLILTAPSLTGMAFINL